MAERFNIAEACLTRHLNSETAEATAMIFVAPDFSFRSMTYRELDEVAARFAGMLLEHGLHSGDRILLRLGNSHVFPAAFFGAVRAGLIPVPTSPFLTSRELAYLASDSGARALVTEPGLLPEKPGVDFVYVSGGGNIPGTISLEAEIPAQQSYAAIHPTDADDPAYLVYTSGTTGFPKGVLHAQRALLGRQPAAAHWFDFVAGERILHSGKFNWTYVLGTGMMDPLYHGKTVVVFAGESAAETWTELIRRFGCTTFIGVPTVFRQILQKTAADTKTLPSLRHAMSAGEHLTDTVADAWLKRFGFPVYEGLGMSECSYYISQHRSQAIRPGTAGKVQPGHRVRILDADLREVAPETEGMLCIHRSDPGLFLRYWNRPEENASLFQGEWFLTGDYAVADAEGYIRFMGRRDDIIKSFGYRISPFEIERVFRDHEAIADVIAFAERIDTEKNLVALCIVLKPGALFQPGDIIAWGKERLASYKLPRKIYRLEHFPRSANGKVLRSQIPGLLGLSVKPA